MHVSVIKPRASTASAMSRCLDSIHDTRDKYMHAAVQSMQPVSVQPKYARRYATLTDATGRHHAPPKTGI